MDMKRRILLMILMFVVYFLVHYGMQYYNEYAISKETDKLIETIKETSKEEYPDEVEIVAMQKTAARRSEENMNAQGSFEGKRKAAADTFFGFYLVNVRTRMEYCRDLGIDVLSFSNLFKETYKKEYSIAKKLREYSLSDIDNLYSSIQPVVMKVIKQDMESLAAGNGMSISESCQLLVDEASQIIYSMHMSTSNPAVYSVLMSNK
jgi:hypothetical protein